jgi:ribose transport system permease protein
VKGWLPPVSSVSARRVAPFLILAVMAASMALLPVIADRSVTSLNGYNALQNLAAYGLLALGLGLTMIAGEFDLSIPGVFALGAMVAVLVDGPPLMRVAAAAAVGVGIGLVQGGIVAGLGINSMPVTLGGFLFALGLTHILGNSQSVPYANFSLGETLDKPLAEIFSLRSLIVLGCFGVVALAIRYTRWGRDLRAVGGGRRASRTAGVRVGRVLVSAFVISGAASAVSGALLAFSLASASPAIGSLDRLVFAATAALIGGVAVTGGQGGAVGIAAGVLSLSILQEEFAILASPTYVSSLVTGALLLTATILAAPELLRRMRWQGWSDGSVGGAAGAAQPAEGDAR